MRYPVAERLKAPQGEGLFTGTPFAFVRLVGCSVGQGVCTACDTEFDKTMAHLGGGLYEERELVAWAAPHRHLCLTGGEPLDRDLRPLVLAADDAGLRCNVETSGTVEPDWLRMLKSTTRLWLCVSPKPGYLAGMVQLADEVKVILGGLGDGPGWPTLADAVAWADAGKLVYVQARNGRFTVDFDRTNRALDAVLAHPQLRLSVQLHKYLRTR